MARTARTYSASDKKVRKINRTEKDPCLPANLPFINNISNNTFQTLLQKNSGKNYPCHFAILPFHAHKDKTTNNIVQGLLHKSNPIIAFLNSILPALITSATKQSKQAQNRQNPISRSQKSKVPNLHSKIQGNRPIKMHETTAQLT